jgi:hypothetical protein
MALKEPAVVCFKVLSLNLRGETEETHKKLKLV